jgi:DNA polymerase III subunit beta
VRGHRFDASKVTGTDLEMTVQTHADVEVMEEGRAVIPGKLLEQAVRRMPVGPVTITTSESDVEILGKGPRFTLRQLSLDDFPTIEDSMVGGTEVDGEALALATGQVTVAASGDAARPILTGVLFESRDEGVRWSPPTPIGWQCGISRGSESKERADPGRGLRELPRTIGSSKVTVSLEGREGVFASDRGSLRLRMIEGTFPKYQSLLPESYPTRWWCRKKDSSRRSVGCRSSPRITSRCGSISPPEVSRSPFPARTSVASPSTCRASSKERTRPFRSPSTPATWRTA